MHPYPEVYLDEVIENQGRLFDLVANSYPDKDTRDFIVAFYVRENPEIHGSGTDICEYHWMRKDCGTFLSQQIITR